MYDLINIVSKLMLLKPIWMIEVLLEIGE